MRATARRLVAAVRGETRVGATALAARAGALLAAEVAAGALDAAGLATLARALVRAQPAMASLCRLADAVLATFDRAPTPTAVADAVAAFEARVQAEAAAIEAAATVVVPPGATVFTLSASSLVERALLRLHREGRGVRVVCFESRPLREGAALAARLGAAGVPTELWIDAAAARCVARGAAGARGERASVVLVGADTLAPAGLLHKIGTLGLALAARAAGVPLYALAGTEKLLPALVAGALDQPRPAGQVLRGAPAGLAVVNRYFDLTPLALLTGVVTAEGVRAPEAVGAAAAAVRLHAALAAELASPGG